MDLFGKFDMQLDISCKRNEKIYFDMAKACDKEPKLVIEIEQARGRAKTLSVEEYLQNF